MDWNESYMMNHSSIDKELYHRLWCECGGDIEATPRSRRIEEAEVRLQEGAWLIGTVYVSIIVCIYFSTLIFLLCKAGYGSTGFLSLVTCAWLDQSEPALGSRRKRRQPSSEVLQKGEKLSCVPQEELEPQRTVATLQVPGSHKSHHEPKALRTVRVQLAEAEGTGNQLEGKRSSG